MGFFKILYKYYEDDNLISDTLATTKDWSGTSNNLWYGVEGYDGVGHCYFDYSYVRKYTSPEPRVTISEPEPIISISTDKTSYNLGERVMMTLEIDRSEEEPQKMVLELELKEPCDEPDLLYHSEPFVMPAVFQKEVTLPIRIDRSIWVSGGEYSFIATLRDPTTDEVIDQDTANFEIVDDMPWTKKLWRNKLRKFLR